MVPPPNRPWSEREAWLASLGERTRQVVKHVAGRAKVEGIVAIRMCGVLLRPFLRGSPSP